MNYLPTAILYLPGLAELYTCKSLLNQTPPPLLSEEGDIIKNANSLDYQDELDSYRESEVTKHFKPILKRHQFKKEVLFIPVNDSSIDGQGGGTNIGNSPAYVQYNTRFWQADPEACQWVILHELKHILFSDTLSGNVVPIISQLAAAFFLSLLSNADYFVNLANDKVIKAQKLHCKSSQALANVAEVIIEMATRLVIICIILPISLKIKGLVNDNFSRYRERQADAFANATCTDGQLKAARRYFLSVLKQNRKNRKKLIKERKIAESHLFSKEGDSLFDREHPPLSERLRTIEEELQKRRVEWDEDEENMKVDFLSYNQFHPLEEAISINSIIPKHQKNDRAAILKKVGKCGLNLKYLYDVYRNDREIVLKAVEQNGKALKYAPDKFKNDPEIVLKAVKQNGKALKHASEPLQNKREIVLAAFKQNMRDVEALQKHNNDTLAVEKIFAKSCFIYGRFVSQKFSNDPEFKKEFGNQLDLLEKFKLVEGLEPRKYTDYFF